MPNNAPYSAIDMSEVMSRNQVARDIVSGFASATPTLSAAWDHIRAALADARDLATEVTRLSAELAAARLWHANALAAMRATIGAQRDGEPDPLYYIRDELNAPQNLSGRAEGSAMTSYRRMRRQARQIRRGGMQPMMFISADSNQFPTPAGMLLARFMWRYRSELAPVAVAALLVGTGWWLHARYPHDWRYVLTGTSLTAWLIIPFGEALRLAPIVERVYAAAVIFTAGVWVAAAAVLGPFTRPLPLTLAIGTVILAVPWWSHRRRRAKVRVERKLAAWPDIARAIGLIGSEVMSATVDVWGWRARFRLARGQTITDVTARIPAIESGLGTFRGAVRIYPTPDDLANRFELRVLDTDPHADAIPWPGPSVRSITEPSS